MWQLWYLYIILGFACAANVVILVGHVQTERRFLAAAGLIVNAVAAYAIYTLAGAIP